MFGKKWNPEGLHIYITGGSQGLGLALAILLVQRGANVSIVARNQDKLDKALELLRSHRRSESQKVYVYSFSLADGSQSTAALEAVCIPYGGKVPDALFLCAGSANPGFFVEMTEEDLKGGMRDGYWVQAWTAWAASKKIAKQKKKNAKIVFVSSTLGLMSIIGWAGYSPAKHAVRGLADTLRHELILYDTDVHIFFPPTMFTPGYENENKTKPKITKEMEEGDDGLTAEQAALALVKGVEKGHVHITGDFLTSLFRASTRGSAPRANWIWEGLMDAVAYIAVPVWRYSADKKVADHRIEHQDYLAQRGFFES